jgi:hypothetical protein
LTTVTPSARSTTSMRQRLAGSAVATSSASRGDVAVRLQATGHGGQRVEGAVLAAQRQRPRSAADGVTR